MRMKFVNGEKQIESSLAGVAPNSLAPRQSCEDDGCEEPQLLSRASLTSWIKEIHGTKGKNRTIFLRHFRIKFLPKFNKSIQIYKLDVDRRRSRLCYGISSKATT